MDAWRGSNEVISVVDHYIQRFLKSSVKKLYVFTDNCRGQNQNITMLRYWQTLVTNKRFEIVHHYFPERGHSFLPYDRHFGVIDCVKVDCAESVEDWIGLINRKFKVVQFQGSMIKDYASTLDKHFEKKMTTSKKKVFYITQYKLFIFYSHKSTVEAHSTINGLLCDEFKMLKPTEK